jgi:cysteine desulfuration protein SufE
VPPAGHAGEALDNAPDFASLIGHNPAGGLYLRRRSPYILPGDHRIGGAMAIDEIIENFSLLDDWDDRYRYVIELGRTLVPLPESERTETNKVQGCASQVWLASEVERNGGAGPVLTLVGDSDAHIVRGLIAILFALYSGKPAREILDTDAIALFDRLGLREHLTPQRSNGFRSMVERIRADARGALAPAA